MDSSGSIVFVIGGLSLAIAGLSYAAIKRNSHAFLYCALMVWTSGLLSNPPLRDREVLFLTGVVRLIGTVATFAGLIAFFVSKNRTDNNDSDSDDFVQCPQCGRANSPGRVKCSQCGHEIDDN